jgi:hypothetical protein
MMPDIVMHGPEGQPDLSNRTSEQVEEAVLSLDANHRTEVILGFAGEEVPYLAIAGSAG